MEANEATALFGSPRATALGLWCGCRDSSPGLAQTLMFSSARNFVDTGWLSRIRGRFDIMAWTLPRLCTEVLERYVDNVTRPGEREARDGGVGRGRATAPAPTVWPRAWRRWSARTRMRKRAWRHRLVAAAAPAAKVAAESPRSGVTAGGCAAGHRTIRRRGARLSPTPSHAVSGDSSRNLCSRRRCWCRNGQSFGTGDA